MAIVLCTLVKFCTFSSPVLVDFCIIWALFLNFCLLFGSFWRSCGSPDHFLRAWGGLGALGAQRSEKGTWRTPPLPGGSLFGNFLQNVLKSAILCCFFVVFFQWQEKVHKIMGKSSKNRVILGSPTLNPIEPARSDRMSAVFFTKLENMLKNDSTSDSFWSNFWGQVRHYTPFWWPWGANWSKKGESKKTEKR